MAVHGTGYQIVELIGVAALDYTVRVCDYTVLVTLDQLPITRTRHMPEQRRSTSKRDHPLATKSITVRFQWRDVF